MSMEGLKTFREIALKMEENWDHARVTDEHGLTIGDIQALIYYCDAELNAGSPKLTDEIKATMDVLRPEMLRHLYPPRAQSPSPSY